MLIPHWPGETPVLPYRMQPYALTTTPLSVARASGTSSTGHGRKVTKFYGREVPDACEIGYTWLARTAIRTPANTEAKLLMLTHAFETWQVLRVCFHTDARNERSRAALERIGGSLKEFSAPTVWRLTTSRATRCAFRLWLRSGQL